MGEIILASASPRKKELLEQIGLTFAVCPAKGEEIVRATEPSEVVRELASQKAQEIASMVKSYGESHAQWMTPQDIMVIGADTIVACAGKILGKPKDEADAFRMLSLLSGQHARGVHRRLSCVSGRFGAGGTDYLPRANQCADAPDGRG